MTSHSSGYRIYKRRWFVLTTVALLNISTNALWMSYPSVTNIVSEYFDKSINAVDLLGTISLYVGIPCCLLVTFIYDYLVRRNTFVKTVHLSSIRGLDGGCSLELPLISWEASSGA